MITIRPYRESDAVQAGCLIADVYRKFNLGFIPDAEVAPYLGPFYYAYSEEVEHKKGIINILKTQWLWVAVSQNNEIVGVLRGKPERLQSLFVREDHHGQGIGRMLVNTFEQSCREQHCLKITLAASLYAVPFYRRLGYKKSTGQRFSRSFAGENFPYQPMKKNVSLNNHT